MNRNISIEHEQEAIVFENYQYINQLKILSEEFVDELDFSKMNTPALISINTMQLDVKKWLEFLNYNYEELNFFSNIENNILPEDKAVIKKDEGKKKYKIYKLNEAPGLFTELAKVNPFDFKDVVKFCKTFGIPYGRSTFDNIDIYLGENNPIVIQRIDFYALTYKLVEYKLIFSIFENVIEKNIDNILKRDQNIAKRTKLFYDHNDADSILTEEKEFLLHLMNDQNLLDLKFSFNPYEEREFYLQNNYLDLIDYSYSQLMISLINGSEFKRCDNCGHLFEATHEKMKFCPPLPFRKRSSCEMAYRNKMRKQ